MNKITDITRRKIADEMALSYLYYHGNLNEPEFLGRIFELKKLPSRDHRFNDAYGDIFQHTVNNNDWDEDWIYSDSRINLSFCDDITYLKFLCQTIHPRIRTDKEEVDALLKIFNKHLVNDNFELFETEKISGSPLFDGREITNSTNNFQNQKSVIKEYFDSNYVNKKLEHVSKAIEDKDSELVIGSAKELLETTCKSILTNKNQSIDKNWTLAQLIKETNKCLDFDTSNSSNPQKAKSSLLQILKGISTIVHGTAELRNSYGSGHGKAHDFKPLEMLYAEFLAGIVSQLVILYLKVNEEPTEIVKTVNNNQMKKLATNGAIKTLYDKIQNEFDNRNPGYNQANQIPGVMYSYNPVVAFIEFSNSPRELKEWTSYELESKELVDHIKSNLSHRVKINYSEKIENEAEKIYLNIEFV